MSLLPRRRTQAPGLSREELLEQQLAEGRAREVTAVRHVDNALRNGRRLGALAVDALLDVRLILAGGGSGDGGI